MSMNASFWLDKEPEIEVADDGGYVTIEEGDNEMTIWFRDYSVRNTTDAIETAERLIKAFIGAKELLKKTLVRQVEERDAKAKVMEA